MNKGGKTRPIYKPCTSTQQNDINHELLNTIPETTNTGNNYNIIKHWLKQGIDSLPKSNPKDKNKKDELSYTSQNVLNQRKEAANTRNPQLFLQLNQQFTKSRRDDKKNKNSRITLQRTRHTR